MISRPDSVGLLLSSFNPPLVHFFLLLLFFIVSLVFNIIYTLDNWDPATLYQPLTISCNPLAATWYPPAIQTPLRTYFCLSPYPLAIIYTAHSMSLSRSDCSLTILSRVTVLLNKPLSPFVPSALALHYCDPLATPPASYAALHLAY